MSRRLTVTDIADVRAYERERVAFRSRMIELKQWRRVQLGAFISLTFENRDTVRYQIQEMARVEHLSTDAEIQAELDAYNPLIPEPGQLCCTLFIELTSDASMREWLPRLLGIETSILLRFADGRTARAHPEATHASMLTRETLTAAVHFLQFDLPEDLVAAFAAGDVSLVCDHPAYREETPLGAATMRELLGDLRQD